MIPEHPRRDAAGFRLRGLEPTRIETFTDAAFAFALTLLVISIEPPTSFGELRVALAGIPAFVLSATMLMMFWWGHHEWSRRYGLDDLTTMVLSCVLVFTVLVYVYPLRFMFGAMMAWIGQLTGARIGQPMRMGAADVNDLFLLYGIGFATMAGAILLLNLHAWRKRAVLELDAVEMMETRAVIGVWAILAATGAGSALLAAATPATLAGIPGWAYSALAVVMPVYRRITTRRRDAVAAATLAAGD